MLMQFQSATKLHSKKEIFSGLLFVFKKVYSSKAEYTSAALEIVTLWLFSIAHTNFL
jgi:hypothetical protein